MRRHPLGWSYPAGAEHARDAPYNERELPDECPKCGKPNQDDGGDPLHDGIFCSQECELEYEEP